MIKHVSRAALAALTFGVGLAFAPPAHADTQGFLNYMRTHGYANAESYLNQAQQQCQALRSGKSEGWLIGQLEHQMSRAESELVVTGAHQYLCPGA
jgi:Protein of unknown function (DUF732)